MRIISPTRLRLLTYAAEALGTAFNLSVGLCAMFYDFTPNFWLAQHLPSNSARLLITGTIYAGSGSLFALSPPGKLSGAHINPSVTLAFWIHGKMKLRDALGYWAAQFTGALAAAALMTFLWGNVAAARNDGMTLPGNGYTTAQALLAEIVMTGVLVGGIFLFVSHKHWARWTPLMVWILVAVEVWLGAPISGTSLNPARSFGPAIIAHNQTAQWIYYAGPLLGSVLAVGLFMVLTDRVTLTAKIFHSIHYPSLFRRMNPRDLPDQPATHQNAT